MTAAATLVTFHGLPAVRLVSPDGAEAVVTLHGAQVLSWIPAGGEERLYLSERSFFRTGSEIRGGIPVAFPQFGTTGPLPRHGFAQTSEWVCIEARTGSDFSTTTLRLSDSEASHALWPHVFAAELTASIGGNRLDVELEVENPGSASFQFTAALHTYLRVDEVEQVRLEGLRGTRYRDYVHDKREDIDHLDALVIAGEVNRVYLNASPTLLLREPSRSLGIHSENLPEVVVWNPWEDKCAEFADMPPGGFRRMLCVEAAVIETPVCLARGESWWGRQTLLAL